MNLLNKIVTEFAKKEFARALQFTEGERPELPQCSDEKQRLLYIHIPFCEQLCPYCSFHRVTFAEAAARSYFQALTKEIKQYKQKGYSFNGIYVGGGTPTVLIDELAGIIQTARDNFPIREVSVETNPNHLTSRNIKILQQAGINRLSVGVQTFNDELLQKIGRYEKYGSGTAIAEKLRETLGSFATLNADMIFNFPGQTAQALNDDLNILIGLNMEQITFYPLMVSDFAQKLMRETMGEVNLHQEKKLYKLIVRRLEKDYNSSSAWCFSRKTEEKPIIDEYVVDYDEYAGLGSGAIGYIKGTCYANTFDIAEYIATLQQNKLPLQALRHFNLQDQKRYDFLMKLFSTKMNVETLEAKYDGSFLKSLWKEMLAFELAGALRYFPPSLFLTPRGRYLWVIIMREFFIAVNNFRDYCRNRAGIS